MHRSYPMALALSGLLFLAAGCDEPKVSPEGAKAAAPSAAPAKPAKIADSAVRQQIDRAVSKVYPALVRIDVVTMVAHDGRLHKYVAAGSGAVITPQGHVVTNHHVAGRADRLTCRLSDGEEVPAKLIGTDPLADISIIQMDLSARKPGAKPLAVAAWGDSDVVRVGDTVMAMGCPMAVSQSVTLGIISNTQMIMPGMFWPMTFKLDGEDVGTLVRWLAHDAVIFGGNSGGPLVNMDGQIIGINEIGLGSLGGAIPASLARNVADQLIKTGKVDRSWIGLEVQPRLKDSAATCGAMVSGVIAKSPAARAGLKAGDLVTSYDGAAVSCCLPEELPMFNRLVLGTPIGKKVKIVAQREGKEQTFEMTTIARGEAEGKDEELRNWGITAREFTMMSALEGQRDKCEGVQVHSIREGGPAAEAKPPLDEEDVILDVAGQAVKDVAALRAVTAKLTEGKTERVAVLVGFERKEKKFLTVVRVGKEPPEENPAQARKAWLGVQTQVLTRELAEALNRKGDSGVRVTHVLPGTTAEQAKLKVGDLILKLDGTKIDASRPEETEVFPNMIRQYKPGVEVDLDIVRDGKDAKLKAKLELPPTPPSELKRFKDDDFEFAARNLATEDRVSRKIDEKVRGVFIDKVEMAGWAALAHVAIGDVLVSVNGKDTASVEALEAAMKQIKKEKARRVVFFVKRGIHTMYLELEPNWRADI